MTSNRAVSRVIAILAAGGALMTASHAQQYRTIDGTYNNLHHPEWGSAGIPLLRTMDNTYADGKEAPADHYRPNVRSISNKVCRQRAPKPTVHGVTDYFWQWGQFIDHDIDLTPEKHPFEAYDINVPKGDPWFDPYSTGTQIIPLVRSDWVYDEYDVRQQVNHITAYLDASMVYGSDDDRAYELRTNDGTGRLKTTSHPYGDLLPFNENGFANAPTADDPSMFLAGDVRANEQSGLTAMHTLFVREHNYWADWIGRTRPHSDGDYRYETARAIVAAEIQHITYEEFLPLLLGEYCLPEYGGYDHKVNAGIANEFSTAAYRFGHTMLSPQLLRLDKYKRSIDGGPLSLADAFFDPTKIIDNGGIDPILRGLAHQVPQEIDPHLVDEVRNMLFGPPGSGGLDLASLNMQRGRDHGLAHYNDARVAMGLQPKYDLDSISSDADVTHGLKQAYRTVHQVDFWLGGLCEDKADGAMVGPLFQAILKDQFDRLRKGDRYWYEKHLSKRLLKLVKKQKLSTIIRRNTDIGYEIPDHVFLYDPHATADADGPSSTSTESVGR